MTRNEIYNKIQSEKMEKAGLDVDYLILLEEESKTIYLLFHGTETFQDLLIDIDFPSTVYKDQENYLKAHRGFVKAWKSARDEIMAKLTSIYLTHDYKVVIAGHSLGGAMAIFAAEDFHFKTGDKCELITYGCPRVMANKKSAEYVTSCCLKVNQYMINSDPIPRIPFGYKHLRKDFCGDKFNLFKMIFSPLTYHLGYGEIDYTSLD